MINRNLKDILQSEAKNSTADSLYLAELQLTRAELAAVVKQLNEKAADEKTIPAIKAFLAKRWERILGTDLIYSEAKTEASTVLCLKVAKELDNILAEKQEIAFEKTKEDIQKQKLLAKEEEIKKVRAKREKIDATAKRMEQRRLEKIAKEKALQEAKKAEEAKKIEDEKNAQIEVALQNAIAAAEKSGNHSMHFSFANILTPPTAPEIKEIKQVPPEEKIPAVIEEIKQNETPAQALEYKEPVKISQPPKQKHFIKINYLNSLLMPTVSRVAWTSDSNTLEFNQCGLNDFILSDDGEKFIPIHAVFLEIENNNKKNEIKFKIANYNQTTYLGKRYLSENEIKRFLAHSSAARKYYEGIEAILQQKNTEKTTQNFLAVIKEFLIGNKITDLPRYLHSLEKSKEWYFLMEMGVYCRELSAERKFGDILQTLHYSIYKQDGQAVRIIENIRNNLNMFIENRGVILQGLKTKPLKTNSPLSDPEAVRKKFLDDLKNNTDKSTASYGEEGRNQLLNNLYNINEFPRIVTILEEPQQLADYLKAMPVDKIPIFIQHLPIDKLKNLFNSFGNYDLEMVRIWHFMSRAKQVELYAQLDDGKKICFQYDNYLAVLPDNILKDFFLQASEETLNVFFNRHDIPELQLARVWRGLSPAQKEFLVEKIENPIRLETILNTQNNKDKQTDFILARERLSRKNTEESTLLLNEIDHAKKCVPVSNLHLLTDFTHRAALRQEKPLHDANSTRFLSLTQKMADSAWGHKVAGTALILFGVSLMAAAGVALFYTAGGSSFISYQIALAGAKLTALGASALTTSLVIGGVKGLVMAAAVAAAGEGAAKLIKGSSQCATGHTVAKLTHQAHSFFKATDKSVSPNEAKVEPVQPTVRPDGLTPV